MGWLDHSVDARNAALAAGFTRRPPQSVAEVAPLLPFAEFRSLGDCSEAMWIADGRAVIWLLDYDYVTTQTQTTMVSGPHGSYTGVGVHGETDTVTVQLAGTILAIRHPDVIHHVDLVRDWRSSTSGSVIDALLWIPPFTFVKAIQLAKQADNPDREIGRAAFDEHYLVHAASEAIAREAITPAFGDGLAAVRPKGPVALRPGWVLIKLDPATPGAECFHQRHAFARGVVAALTRRG